MGPEIFAALLPLVTDGIKQLFGKFIIGDAPKPTNIGELLQLRAADLEWFKAVNDAGGRNPSYPWVEAAIRLQRPTIAAIVFLTWGAIYLGLVIVPSGMETTASSFAQAIGFYLFGDRTLFYSQAALRQKGK